MTACLDRVTVIALMKLVISWWCAEIIGKTPVLLELPTFPKHQKAAIKPISLVTGRHPRCLRRLLLLIFWLSQRTMIATDSRGCLLLQVLRLLIQFLWFRGGALTAFVKIGLTARWGGSLWGDFLGRWLLVNFHQQVVLLWWLLL